MTDQPTEFVAPEAVDQPVVLPAEPQVAVDADGLPDEETFAKAEVKPPRYRLVRGAMYTIYMIVVAWFCISITVSAWQSVWGEAGLKIKAQAPIAPAR